MEILDGKLDEVINKFKSVLKPVVKEESSNNIEELNKTENWSLKCNLCECMVPSSSISVVLSEHIGAHLYGKRHDRNLKRGGGDRSVDCQFCECTIVISEDNDSSFKSVEEHMNSKHSFDLASPKVESGENTVNIMCKACNISLPCSNNSLVMILNHLGVQTHIANIKQTPNKTSVLRCFCKNYVPISEDPYSSFINMEGHFNEMHIRKVPTPCLPKLANTESEGIPEGRIICKVCQCPISCPDDIKNQEKFLINMWNHIDGRRHANNLAKAKSNQKYFFCGICNCTICIFENSESTRRNFESHIISKMHVEKIEALHSSKLEHKEKSRVKPVDRCTFSITCKPCKCTIPIPIDSKCNSGVTMDIKNICDHISSERHIDKTKRLTDGKSLQCNLCVCAIPISGDVTVSLERIARHLYGEVHFDKWLKILKI